jgi:threo-3-hydroxy-L-aspartate ammonia-lyase
MVNFKDIEAAAQRLEGVAHRTPVVTSHQLDDLSGGSVFLKCENFQRMGAFKFRGAYNRLVQLSEEERNHGVIAYSSGNHAQGVALAAKILGMKCSIVMPLDAPASKRAATAGYGAEIVDYDRHREDRLAIAQRLAEKRGAVLVPPFNDENIIAGQGTAAFELIKEVGPLDVLLVCTGGGGLLSGSAIAAKGLCPFIRVFGVEPEAGDDFRQSLRKGSIVKIDVPNTIADGMQTQSAGEITFEIVRNYCEDIVVVSDDELRTAMRFAFERLKIVIEPSGAAGLAAALFGKVDITGKRVGVIISGGNVDAEVFSECIKGIRPLSAVK